MPLGTKVNLDYDQERTDRYGRTLAAVSKDGRMVSTAIAEAGLGLPVTFGANQKWRPEVDEALSRAATDRVGFFDPRQRCTVPGQVAALSQARKQASDGLTDPSSAGVAKGLSEAMAALALAESLETTLARTDSVAVRALGSTAIEGVRQMLRASASTDSEITTSLRARLTAFQTTKTAAGTQPSEGATAPSASGPAKTGKYTGCRAYNPGGKTWKPIPCP